MAWFFPGRAPARQIEDDLSGSTVLQTGGRAKRIRAEGIDWSILFITGFLLAFGSLMVYSASISLADSPKFDTSYTHFFVRHLISIAVAAVAGSIVYRIPMRFWERVSGILVIIAVLLLIAVLIPGVGHSVNGARRWIGFGSLTIQVTEIAKFAALIGAAGFTATMRSTKPIS